MVQADSLAALIRRLLTCLPIGALLCSAVAALAQPNPLPSWNDGPAKQAIVRFVQETTDPSSPKLVPPAERIATFDQDGTLWVEQPLYTQVVYCLDRVRELVKTKPELKTVEPFKTVLADGMAALAKLSAEDLTTILAATLTGMSVDEFRSQVAAWLAQATHPRWKRPYTELVYQPMLEVMRYLRANGYRTYIVTGGGQDFVRVYADRVYAVPPEQIVGSVAATRYDYDADGRPVLIKVPTLLLTDDKTGKPEGINMMIGRRPVAAFGNSTGDREMLEYTGAGTGARLMMLVLHDDAQREYAYGPANGLPDSKVGHFSQALYDEATHRGWSVISMQRDWKRLFAFE
jgi:phosphoglycolate phosphatase-like HAD superfamily hydrolase